MPRAECTRQPAFTLALGAGVFDLARYRAARRHSARPRGPARLALVAAGALASACIGGCGGPGSGGADSAPPPGAPGAVAESAPPPPVRPGIEVLLSDSAHLIEGRRVGLVTNRSAVASTGESSIDLLHGFPGARLAALFAPEHGIRGTEAEGAAIAGHTDAKTGLPVHSLYGEHRAPTPETLAEIDVLAFDLQDVGARYYTYASTLAYSMQAAGAAGVPVLVLDRPNPIGGAMQGPVLDPAFASFVGLFPVPVRHGLTMGELARLFGGEFGVGAELHIVPADGWSGSLWFDQTELPWIAPSLNMPSLESAAHYPGTCLFEGTNISVGRGTPAAFQMVGAPWLDGEMWAAAVAAYQPEGVRIEAVAFTPESPSDGKFAGEPVEGIRFSVTDRSIYDPVGTAVAALLVARRLAGDRWEWRESHFDRLAGTDRLRHAIDRGDSLAEITAEWATGLAAFEARSRPYLIYPR